MPKTITAATTTNNKAQLLHLAETLDESNLAPIVTFANAYLKMLDDALDDAFCEKLWEDYENDPDKSTVSFEECMKELGLNEKDLQN